MASSKAVWGIDIGQCALKALRCRLGDDGETVIADAYDYIEYPKILSQPEANPDELVREAFEQFLSRNELHGDQVAMSVPGQSGLSRFFKPPPVDEKTLPDIVKYEVKQQIPFPIEDVIWDWQKLGGTVVDGVTVDAEVGLFAMKRDAVFRALKPFTDANIEVDIVQLAPLATYNVVCHDILESIPDPDEVDMDNPPESMVVVSIGTDTSDLIVTNGLKLWLRNIPIGGNHFTKQLSRELKLTLAKAEHLKRNARKAEDPKTVFQAMRPVFNDLVTEIQRSLSFFQSMEKSAQVKKIALLGNAAKLPGLRQFLTKQLDMGIAKVNDFRLLQGESVTEQKSFSDNILSFAPCYGLCLQGLDKAHTETNLLPEEFHLARVVRAKKPWVLASVGALMLGAVLMLINQSSAKYRVSPEYETNGVTWEKAGERVSPTAQQSARLKNQDTELKTKLDRINAIGEELRSASNTRSDWLELTSAIYQALPEDELDDALSPNDVPFQDRPQLYIDHVESAYAPEIELWFESVEAIYEYQFIGPGMVEFQKRAIMLADNAIKRNVQLEKPKDEDRELTGPGWIIEIKAHHYMTSDEAIRRREADASYVAKTILTKLIDGSVTFPGAENETEGGGSYRFSDFGVFYPTMIDYKKAEEVEIEIPNASDASLAAQLVEEDDEAVESDDGKADSNTETSDDDDSKEEREVGKAKRFDFVIQFAWIPRSPKERFLAKKHRLQAAAELAKKNNKSGDNDKSSEQN